MTLEDQPTFAEAFRRMVIASRVRMKPAQVEEAATIYFKILQGWTLEQVLAAGKVCLETRRGLPQVADWLAALPRKVDVASDLRWMGVEEAREYLRAEALRYEDAPCDCLLCQEAGVTDQPLRFVPDFGPGNTQPDRAFHQGKNAAVVSGHWAHGEELARWYVARAAFYSVAITRGHLVLVPVPLQLVAAGVREPGEEG